MINGTLSNEGSRHQLDFEHSSSEDLVTAFGAIWCELLGVETYQASDDFFALGGCSLDSVALQLRVMRRLGIDLPMHVIIDKRRFGSILAELRARSGLEQPLMTRERSPTLPETTTIQSRADEAMSQDSQEIARRPIAEENAVSRDAESPARGEAMLSFPERSLYVTQQWDPASTAYVESIAFELTGPLDAGLLHAALEALVSRHANLRTTYHATSGLNAVPQRMVHDELAPEWVIVSHHDEPPDAPDGWWPSSIMDHAQRPMPLSTGPLVRCFLWKRAECVHRLLLQIHHIAIDEWSLRILFEEWSVLYNAGLSLLESDRKNAARLLEASGLPSAGSSYATWASRHTGRSAASDASVAWWREQLEGYPTQFEFPADCLAESGEGRQNPGAEFFRFEVPEAVVAELKRIAGRWETTLNTAWLALDAAFWSRLTAQERLILGYPVSLRDEADTERMLGYFLNLLPIPCQVDATDSFRSLLLRTHQRVVAAYQHRDAPFHRIVQAVGDLSASRTSPLIQQVLVCLDRPMPGLGIRGIGQRPLRPVFSAPKWDLLLTVFPEGGAYQAEWEYDPRRFPRESVARLAERFLTFVRAAVEEPGTALAELPCIGPAEREMILAWEDGGAPDHAWTSVTDSFKERSRSDPGGVAVRCGSRQLTYGELDAWSDHLANELAARGIKRGDVVALAIPRSIELIVGMLGVLKSGAAYMPLDVSDPIDRQEILISIANVSLTIWSSRDAMGDHWATRCRYGAVEIDSVPRHGGSKPVGAVASREDPAYVMFTSGSTGEPKAVVVPQRGILRLTCPASFMRLDRTVAMLHHSPAMFDASTLEIWGPLLNGGRVVILPDGPLDLARLKACIKHNEVNALWLTAALFHLIVDEMPELFHALDQVLTGGDVVSPAHVRRLLEREPHLVVINGYGPTENTTFTTTLTMTARDLQGDLFRKPLPIGRPIRGTRIRIADSEMRRVPIGVPGELLASGSGLALGYLGRDDLTRERFVPLSQEAATGPSSDVWYRTGDLARWRADGSMDFLGRKDRQVKINGYRIEPGEIENVLRRIDGVRDAHVAVRQRASHKPRLLAWVVPEDPARFEMTRVEQIAAAHLPRHMVPSGFITVDQIPLTRNGKVDSAALPAPFADAAPAVPGTAPEACAWSADEEIVVELWEKLLGHRRFDRTTDFFQAGGDSLATMQLVLELEHAFGRPVTMSMILPDPTVPKLAKLVHLSESALEPRADHVSFRTEGSLSPFCMYMGLYNDPLFYLPLRSRLRADHPIHVFPYPRAVDPETGLVTVRAIASRLIQTMDAIELRQSPILVGFSFGANVAYEVACQLAQQGRPPAQLVLIDAIPRRLWSIPRVCWYIVRDLGKYIVTRSKQAKNSLVSSLYNVCEFIPDRWLARSGPNRAGGGINTVERPSRHDLLIAHKRNRVRPYEGPAVLIRGSESRLVRKRYEHDLGWGPYIPRLEVHVVPGQHHDILTGQGLEGIARILNEIASRTSRDHVQSASAMGS
jgi:amino acid adenylation domain-containing protein